MKENDNHRTMFFSRVFEVAKVHEVRTDEGGESMRREKE